MSKNIAVIGAGITGVLSAYFLTKAGHKVTVIEKELYPAMKCSYANGGQISVSNSEVWTTWSNVHKGIKWMFQKDAPLLIKPALSFDKLRWMTKFLYYTATDSYTKNTLETIKLGLDSRELYKKILVEEQISFDQSYCGILHFYKDQDYFQNAVNVKELYNSAGCEWDILNSDQEVKRIDFALKDIQGIIGGAWTPSDWTGDIHKFCAELSSVLIKKYKVKFLFDTNIEEIEDVYDIDNFDKIIISNGVGSTRFAKKLGDKIDVYPVKGYSITIQLDHESKKYAPRVSLLDDQAKIVTSTLGNRLRVAGTAELTGENYDITRDRIEPLLNWVNTNFPRVRTENYSSWACLRPMTSNMMPIIKQSDSDNNIFYHTGHGHLGWTLSPATAKILTELINER